MGDTVYIHYGDNTYRMPRPIKNDGCWIKPHGGLWASRKDDPLGWKNWCECEEFHLDRLDKFFEFTLKDGTRVLELSKEEQLYDLPQTDFYHGSQFGSCRLDFEELAKTYDAIELTDIGALYWALYGWDCNSILIMNPNCIDIKEEYLQ